MVCVNPGEPWPDVACTRAAFTHRFPGEPHGSVAPPPSTGNPVFVGVGGGAWAVGAYDQRDPLHVCWFVCSDPSHPTAAEWLRLKHERCHRVQQLEGWAAAAPLWAALYREDWALVTSHPAIAARLRAEGYIR